LHAFGTQQRGKRNVLRIKDKNPQQCDRNEDKMRFLSAKIEKKGFPILKNPKRGIFPKSWWIAF